MISIFNNIIHTFEYFDRPILFVSKMNKSLFLISLAEDNYEYEKWIISPLTPDEYILLLHSDLDFYSCLNQHKENLRILINKNGDINEEQINNSDLGCIESYFPRQGLVAKELISDCSNSPSHNNELHR